MWDTDRGDREGGRQGGMERRKREGGEREERGRREGGERVERGRRERRHYAVPGKISFHRQPVSCQFTTD